MLIKKELELIPVAKLDKFTKSKHDNFFAVAHIAATARGNEILTVEFYKKDCKDLFCRFFTDGKGYIFYLFAMQDENERWSKKQAQSIMFYDVHYIF